MHPDLPGLYYLGSVVLAPAELPSVERVLNEEESVGSVEEAGATHMPTIAMLPEQIGSSPELSSNSRASIRFTTHVSLLTLNPKP